MDLGITGRIAFVAASSQGLGLACATSLAREGASVILNGRSSPRLVEAARALRAAVPEAQVSSIAADLTTREGRAAIVAAHPRVDILVTNNVGPPPGPWREWDEAALRGAFEANALPAIELIRAWVPGMQERRFGRVVNITSAMVTEPDPIMGLSASARTALTAVSKAISREVVRDNVTINNLLPERIDTPRQEFMAARIMAAEGVTREQAREVIASTVAARRLGRPEEFGDACAFLCSAQAGYLSGQNVHIDGGSHEGLI
ncbi:MAG: SDR family oxidoreductase [Arthrobacter sp.]|jgi:3-oxoacyl-[acyl-carrier protein] reductase|nr:SDR family oxidoreductase [Arthrobacter sp.]